MALGSTEGVVRILAVGFDMEGGVVGSAVGVDGLD
jgi:hypothetical protein